MPFLTVHFFSSGAPKWAGQSCAYVSHLPEGDPSIPFSVFVMRQVKTGRQQKKTTLGWEYCGEYRAKEDALNGFTAARSVSFHDKRGILKTIYKSLESKEGVWHESLNRWKEKIRNICAKDQSRPGPSWLIRLANGEAEPDDDGKEREERLQRESSERATMAARARALGLDRQDLSNEAFAEKLLELDEFYNFDIIEFVSYDEEVYNFVKDGETTKTKFNRKRKAGDAPCKASDWYAYLDQSLEENERAESRSRKEGN